MSRGTLQRELKLLVEKGLADEVGTGAARTPPNTISRYCDKP